MNFKANATVHNDEPETTTVRFEIPGLREIMLGTFELDGVKPITLRFERVIEMLQEAGIEEHAANVYVDQFADLVTSGEMAKLLARRMKRVG